MQPQSASKPSLCDKVTVPERRMFQHGAGFSEFPYGFYHPISMWPSSFHGSSAMIQITQIG